MPDGGMWDMSQLVLEELRRCCGYKGEWACEKDYPDHMLPFSEFGICVGSKDGLHHMCKSCMSMRDVTHHAISNIIDNAVSKIAYKVAGSSKSFYKLPKEERISIRKDAKRSYLLDHRPEEGVIEFLFPETKESVITQRTVNHKTRNQALATKLKELYNYTCQVEDCNETEVEIAHIYKHSLPDSVDDETNAWCLCCNHHRAYDANRMIFNPALDGRFIRYDRFGKIYEIGRIIYDDKHTIDIKWVRKSREWHDNTKK